MSWRAEQLYKIFSSFPGIRSLYTQVAGTLTGPHSPLFQPRLPGTRPIRLFFSRQAESECVQSPLDVRAVVHTCSSAPGPHRCAEPGEPLGPPSLGASRNATIPLCLRAMRSNPGRQERQLLTQTMFKTPGSRDKLMFA